jgi:DNA-binding NarL/FixJ family response regulator
MCILDHDVSPPLRIVHCDDSPDVLLLVEHWFEDHPDLDVVASALGIRAAIEMVELHKPDVVVTDTLGSPREDSLLRWLHDAAPDARLVVYTGYRPHQLAPDLVRLTDRIVTKTSDDVELVAALRSLAAGRDEPAP